jgi:hypothetical protein
VVEHRGAPARAQHGGAAARAVVDDLHRLVPAGAPGAVEEADLAHVIRRPGAVLGAARGVHRVAAPGVRLHRAAGRLDDEADAVVRDVEVTRQPDRGRPADELLVAGDDAGAGRGLRAVRLRHRWQEVVDAGADVVAARGGHEDEREPRAPRRHAPHQGMTRS